MPPAGRIIRLVKMQVQDGPGLLPFELGRGGVAWPQFLRGCGRYRESLDREFQGAPAEDVESN
jgi:hypothetical protein